MKSFEYDLFGWLVGETDGSPRSTAIAPPAHGPRTVGQPYPNWTGYAWGMVDYTEPPAPPEPPPAPYAWFIDIGPFFDRFGAVKMAVLMSADPGVKAIIADVQIRKWIDLRHRDVIDGLAYVGTKVPALTAELQAAILTTPVSDEENRALRKLYFE